MASAFDLGYKPGQLSPVLLDEPQASTSGPLLQKWAAAAVSPLASAKAGFDDWRRSRGYITPGPGAFEDIGRPMRNLLASAFLFDGAKAELQKTVSMNPVFQVSHGFAVGSTAGPAPSPGTYNFSAIHGTDSSLVTGMIDGDGSMQGRAHFGWIPASDEAVSKLQFQIGAGPMAGNAWLWQQDLNGPGYNASLKLINPSVTTGTGSASLSTFYAVTHRLLLGAELLAQRAPFQSPQSYATDVGAQFGAKVLGDNWAGTIHLSPASQTTLGYIHKLNERVEAGAELALLPSLQPRGRQAVATLGVKYEYRPATFRGQVDSTGKIAAYLEHRLNPAMSFLLSGEIDHSKNTSKFGVGFQLDTASVDEQTAMNTVQPRPPT